MPTDNREPDSQRDDGRKPSIHIIIGPHSMSRREKRGLPAARLGRKLKPRHGRKLKRHMRHVSARS